MKAGFALNIERLYGPAIIRVAAKHLLRELAAELGADSHIDAARIKDNVILRGPDTSAGVAALAKSLMDVAGVTKCRKGAVMGLELLFTLPAVTAIDPRQYFEQATRWAEQYFGVPVLSCVIHADEGAVHAHALLLPLIDGRMGGSDLHGGKAKLAAMQTSFHETVGAPHGLPKYVPQKRLSAPVRTAAMDLARRSLQANAALNDDIIDVLLAPHAKDPAPLLLALGIAMPTTQTPAKDFVSMMISPCKAEKRSHIGEADYRHIGKQTQPAPTVSLPDTCVGEGNPASSNTGQNGIRQYEHLAAPHQPGAGDLATHSTQIPGDLGRQHSPESSGQLDALIFQDILPPITGPAKRTNLVRLVEQHQAAAGVPSNVPRPKPATTAPAPCADEMRPHKDASRCGLMCHGGRETLPPAGVPNFGRAHAEGIPNSGYTPSAGGDLLKTQQVDQQAGHVSARWRSFKGGAGIAPPTSSPDHRATGPPASARP